MNSSQRAFLLLGILFTGLSNAEIDYTYTTGIIGHNSIQPPPDTFLLIRKKDKLCAIKFTEFKRGNDKSEPNIFHSGEESFYAKYVWYLGEKKSAGWSLTPPIAHGESELSSKRLVGIGRFAFGGGNTDLSCRDFKLSWTPPGHVYFYKFGYRYENSKYDTEMALTKWHAIQDIRLDESLEWLKYDENRPYSIVRNAS